MMWFTLPNMPLRTWSENACVSAVCWCLPTWWTMPSCLPYIRTVAPIVVSGQSDRILQSHGRRFQRSTSLQSSLWNDFQPRDAWSSVGIVQLWFMRVSWTARQTRLSVFLILAGMISIVPGTENTSTFTDLQASTKNIGPKVLGGAPIFLLSRLRIWRVWTGKMSMAKETMKRSLLDPMQNDATDTPVQWDRHWWCTSPMDLRSRASCLSPTCWNAMTSCHDAWKDPKAARNPHVERL